MAETPQATAPRAKSVFAHSGFLKLLAASFMAALGDRFYQAVMVAATSSIFTKDTANREFGNVQVYSIVPMLILYAFVGSLVDGTNRRRLLAWMAGIKVFLVLGFAVLFRNYHEIQKTDVPGDLWFYGLGLIVLMNIISVPFSPARMAVVPDVLPEERRSIGASLIATAGLFSYLVGSAAGIPLASFGKLGPIWMSVIASVFYVASYFMFNLMPDATAVPGNQRKGTDELAPTETPPKKMSVGEYLHEQYGGLLYCVRRPSIIALIFFETTFWIIASMMLTLIAFYASDVLKYSDDAKNTFIGKSLGIAGLGLLTGALTVGKISRNVTPILTYFPAFILIAIGFQGVFGSQPIQSLDGILVAGWSFLPLLFLLAFGGGAVLGRVDADVLAIADERFRGRIFALKAVCFAACTLASLIWISNGLTPDGKFALIAVMPRIVLWSLPLVFIFAWLIDAAIWSQRSDFHAPNFRERMQFKLCRFILRCWIKVHFGFSVEGAEHIPTSGPVVLASNHGSFMDPIFLGCASPRMVQYLMYRSYYVSVMHPLFRFLSAIPVDEKKSLLALKTGVASLEKGCCIGLFPEGMVAHRPELNPAQGGALFLAQKSGAPIVPTALKGDWDVLPRGAIFPRAKKVTVVFCKPFVIEKNASKQEVAEATDKMMKEIADVLKVPPPARKNAEKPADPRTPVIVAPEKGA